MTEPAKPLPTVEQSLKYMSWDVKELTKTMQKMCTVMENYLAYFREQQEERKGKPKDESFPF